MKEVHVRAPARNNNSIRADLVGINQATCQDITVTGRNAPNNEVPDAKTRARRGGRSPRRKGNGFEREVVAALQELGLAAERVPLSGSVKGGKFDHDISCPVRGVDRRLECKRRTRAFARIDTMLAGNFALIVRDDRSRPLVVMTLTTFAELAGQPDSNSEASSPLANAVCAAAENERAEG
jgi:Holliday junction resolvase